MAYIRCSGNSGGSLKVRTASGNPCTFTTDLADALVSLTADIVAKQDLHGYDHPWAGGAGKNLFDKSTISDGFWIKPDGTTDYSPDRMYSDLIRIKPNTQYYITNTIGGNDFFSTIHYDSELNIIGAKNVGGSGDVAGTITSYNNSAYMRINSFIADLNTVMVSEGSQATPYEPYSNICPFIGHSELNLWRLSNKNRFNGTFKTIVPIFLPEGATICASCSHFDTGSINIRYYDIDGVEIDYWSIIFDDNTNNRKYRTFSMAKDAYFCKFDGTGTATDYMVTIGNNSTPYEPYNGDLYTVAFGQTVYGGVYDKSGRLTITHGYKTYNGSENWSRHPSDTTAWFYITETVFKNQTTDILSNMFTYNAGRWNVDNSIWDIYNQIHIRPDSTISPSGQTDAGLAEFKAYLALHPLEVCVELATPIVIDVPSISVFAVNGVNNIVSDGGGSIDVSYLELIRGT